MTMLKRRTVPTKPRFAYAVKRAYEVLAHIGATTLPIDPVKIGDFYPEIHIASYTELKENTGEADPLFFSERNARYEFLESFTHTGKSSHIDGETRRIRGRNDFLLVYDDRIGSEYRIRWTIAHELGHIFLGHFTQFDITTVVRGETGTRVHSSLSDKEYGVLEVEAHYFAAAFLVPATVVKKIPCCKTPRGIMDICAISEDAAIRRLNELRQLPYGSYETEAILNRNFYNYIKKTNHPNTAVFTPALDGLPEQYEDYAEYDYWNYVVASIGEREKNTELRSTLMNSIALYDDSDMLIIIDTEINKNSADKYGETILCCLKKYGMTPIESFASLSMEALNMLC